MIHKKFVVLICISTLLQAAPDWNQLKKNDPLFDKKFLANSAQVRQYLINNHNFKEITFTTPDGVKLAGLLRTVPHATTNIISCAGFYPGAKECLATLVHVAPNAPENNILLFDARGHGQSEGSFWGYRGQYGMQEYNDVIGAIDFMHKQSPDQPTIVHSVCMGGLHASHALIQLSNQKDAAGKSKLEEYNVRGLVFDSGSTELPSLRDVFVNHPVKAMLPQLFKHYHPSAKTATKDEIMRWYSYKAIAAFAKGTIVILRSLFVDPALLHNDHDTRLDNKMHTIACPVWLSHAQEDDYTKADNTKKLAEHVPVKQTYWFKDEKDHADNLRKHPQQYHDQFAAFITFCKSDGWKKDLENSELHKQPLPRNPHTVAAEEQEKAWQAFLKKTYKPRPSCDPDWSAIVDGGEDAEKNSYWNSVACTQHCLSETP